MGNSSKRSLPVTDVVTRQKKLLVPRHQCRVFPIGQAVLELLAEILVLLRGLRLNGRLSRMLGYERCTLLSFGSHHTNRRVSSHFIRTDLEVFFLKSRSSCSHSV